mgnify:CR=1 FL=1
MTKLDKSFEELLSLVSAGVEYPEAHTRVSLKYHLSEKQAKKLTEKYDQE